MPRPRLRSRPLLAATAVAATAALTLSSCQDSEPERRDQREPMAKGPAPVRAPTDRDQVLGTEVAPAKFRSPVEQPNFLMITTDDASLKDLRYLPQVRKLIADQGVEFVNGTAPTPICAPARASLLTGQNANNHGVTTIQGEGGGFEAFDDDETLPVWLQDVGYDTMFLGKYINGYGQNDSQTYTPPGWTEWRGMVDPTTYNFVKPTVSENGEVRTYERYSTTLLSDMTQDLLTDPEREQAPWYMWVNYVAPHHGGPTEPDDPKAVYPDDDDPVKTTTPEPRDRNKFDGLELPDTPDMFEKDVRDKRIVKPTQRNVDATRRAQLTEARQQRLESLQSVDRAVARAIRTLASTDQLDRTYVVFTSDNGYVLGEHNMEGKLWYFRDIVNVPMVARGPGIKPGTVSRAPVTNADWATTFAALAGAEPTRTTDGVDIMPWIDSGATRRVVPIAGYPVRGGTTPRYSGVVVGPWTYVRDRKGREELYYRTVDRYQLDNLRRDPRYRPQLRELRRLAERYADCAGSECPSEFYR